LSLKGTDILATLKSADELFGSAKQKVLLIFTDGGDETNFSEEIAYAKAHNIAVYIYSVGTSKGGVIQTKHGVLKDKNGILWLSSETIRLRSWHFRQGEHI